MGDRLIQYDSTNKLYYTEHLSYLRIKQTTGAGGQPCFDVWDKAGTFYEVGCTTDSLEYTMSGTTRNNYLWNVDRIVAPNEGPSGTASKAWRLILISYLQDCGSASTTQPCPSGNTIRDSVIKQIRAAGQQDQPGQRPHHVIPCATMGPNASPEARAIVQGAGGWDFMNSAANGRWMWSYKDPDLAMQSAEPWHANNPTYQKFTERLLETQYPQVASGTISPLEAATNVIGTLNAWISAAGMYSAMTGESCSLGGFDFGL